MAKNNDEMNSKQLALVARLLRSKEPAITAATLVLVKGKSVTEAVEATGMAQPNVTRTVKRFRELHHEIIATYKK